MMKTIEVVAAFVFASLILSGEARAAVLVVDSVADQPDANPGDGQCATDAGDCTLRAAIQEANARSSGRYTILVPPGTYVLSTAGVDENAAATGDLDIIGTTAIIGAGAKVAIVDAAGLDRVFETVGSIDIFGLTIRNGSAENGGGISNPGDGHVILTDVEVVGNSATNVGGGVFGQSGIGGSVAMQNSTLAGNTAGVGGGGAFNLNYIENVTVSGNSAPTGGGVLFLGGALNSTITANSANPGAGGGVYASEVLANTIIAGNTGGNCANVFQSAGNNLSDDTTCNLTHPADLPVAAPLLGPLTHNGGQTRTHALRTGSPAVDRGNNANCPLTDQRRLRRPRDGDANGTSVCDIGAFERQ